MNKIKKPTIKVYCPHCKVRAEMVEGRTLPDEEVGKDSFFRKKGVYVWRCPQCKAMTIAKKKTHEPLGELATKELRKKRYILHLKFDKIWQSGKMDRTMAYRILAAKLGIDTKNCHFSQFSDRMCNLAFKKIDEMLKINQLY